MLYSRLKVITLILIFVLKINAQSISFNQLTVDDGLSKNDVNTLIQDDKGFIWFGTEDGLNRFDGYNFKVFRNDPNDSNSISDNSIWALMCDNSGNIWVGTRDGILNQYNPKTETFSRLNFPQRIRRGNSITALLEDRKGNIYAGTRYGGIFKLDPVSAEVFHWSRDTVSNKGLSHFSVRTIAEDNSGNILIGTYSGLNKFNPGKPSEGFLKFFHEPGNPNSLNDSQIYNLSGSADDPDIIWVGTPGGLTEFNSRTNSLRRIDIPNPDNLQFGSGASTVIEETSGSDRILWIDTYDGLLRLNLNTGEWYRFVHDENDPYSIISNRINKIIKDRSGILWVATENGVSYYASKSRRFNSFFNKEHRFYLNAVKNKKDLKAAARNANGEVWLGFSDGVVKLNYKEQTIYKNRLLENLNAWSLTVDNKNRLWIGTFGQGLKQFYPESGEMRDWLLIYSVTKRPAVSFVKSLHKDSRNNIWAGYWGSGVGRINPVSGNYNLWLTEPGSPGTINNSDVWSVEEDRFGRIWLGTQGGGLNLFEDKDGGIFRNWVQKDSYKSILSSNNIFTIHNPEKGNTRGETILWIGTSNGLNKFIVKNSGDGRNIYDFEINNKSYTVKEGLPDNSVYSILEDDNGNLWLGTGSGISYFDIAEEKFINFSEADGLRGTIMNPEASAKLHNGLMLFGSTKGLNIFDPQMIKLSSYNPNVVFTDFQIFNKSVKTGKGSPLNESILSTNEIRLSHNQDIFSFEFAALDFNSSESIQYAYMLEGFDKDWIYSGSRRFVTYTNLDPGNYIFKVKATNADGVWSKNITALKLIMDPPWWRTPLAYTLYAVLIILGLLGIRRFEMNRTKLRNELKMREFEVKKKSELEELKSRFFANLSHEFRTPLMLIKGPLEQLKTGKVNDSYYENISLIERNSNRLKVLIDQLLELSHLEKAAIPLKAKQENLISILEGLVSSFVPAAEQKNISLKINSELEVLTTWIDKDKFEKIINNLLSNAVKFTPENGKVVLEIKKICEDERHTAEIKISDSGIGIPPDKLEKIFDRFFQVDDSTHRSYGGSGIGLALVKELVELHKWNISVDSKPGKGTEFKLTIPLDDDYLNEEEKEKNESAYNFNETVSEKAKQYASRNNGKKELSELIKENGKPAVLIVDDSEDVRKYLTGLLKNEYDIFIASNGEEGISVAAEKMPDIIISDIMMPSMDGMEFCRRIKSEWQTSDIPVILLTAKASFESRIEGLETGADDYLTKPFNSIELFTRIRNLLVQRERLREKYSKDFKIDPGIGKEGSADDEFIKKVLKLIEDNIDKTNFSTEQLANELFVSRTQLHRKVIAITGQAPGEFIRLIKLKRAAELLITKKLSVTQIAYEIGFSSPAQFTRAFSKHFNCLPSEFSSKNKTKKD